MIQINNKVQKGFFSSDPKIRILDLKRNPFYFIDNPKNSIRFNLPKGIFYTENNLKEIPFVKHKKIILPKPEKRKKIPAHVNIIVGKNPNKASIFVDLNGIILDKEQKEKPSVLLNFILAHELGHYYYYSEKYADSFAYNLLLDYGMNPSQILTANFLTLTNRNESLERKKYLTYKIKNSI